MTIRKLDSDFWLIKTKIREVYMNVKPFKNGWTVIYGQAKINYPFFKTKNEAMKEASRLAKMFNR